MEKIIVLKKISGVFLGLVIIIAVFLPWDNHWFYKKEMGEYKPVTVELRINENYDGERVVTPVRISYFLGVRIFAFDEMLGFHYITIICGLLFIISVFLIDKWWWWKYIGLFSGILTFIIAGNDLLYLRKYPSILMNRTGVGLWITFIAAGLAILLMLFMKRKK